MRHKAIIVVVSTLLLATMATGGYFAFIVNNAPEKVVEQTPPPKVVVAGDAAEISHTLYQYINTSINDLDKVSKLVNSMDFVGFSVESIHHTTDSITINYVVDKRTKYRFMEDYTKNFNQTCAAMFVLVDKIHTVHITVSDNYGEFYSFSRNKSNINYTEQMSDFSKKRFEQATKSEEDFESFINSILTIKDIKNNNVYLKQIYDVLTPDLQVDENSKESFALVLDNSRLEILSPLGLNLTPYKGQQVEVIFYGVENYTILEMKNYVFVFKDKKLVANEVISSPMVQKDIISSLKNTQ